MVTVTSPSTGHHWYSVLFIVLLSVPVVYVCVHCVCTLGSVMGRVHRYLAVRTDTLNVHHISCLLLVTVTKAYHQPVLYEGNNAVVQQ